MNADRARSLRGSPVLFVNGRRIDGVPSLKTLAEYVDAELNARGLGPSK